MGRFVILLVAFVLAATVVQAEERTLSWDSGEFDVFDYSADQGHFIKYWQPDNWKTAFTQELLLFGKAYGEIGELRATILVLGPQTENTAQIEDAPDSLVIHARKQFRVADYFTDQGGWAAIPLDAAELPDAFWVGLFTHSNDERGLMIGLDTPGKYASVSCYTIPVDIGSDEESMILREDNRNWMIRLGIRSTLALPSTVSSADLSGKGFGYYDDGKADDFITMQKYGPILRIKNNSSRRVKRIWIYGFVEGEWFNTDRQAAVYLMDSRYAILERGHLPYSTYTDLPAWNACEFPGTKVPDEFLVLLEPFSRPGSEFMLGYDNSTSNRMSEFGSVGHAELGWPLDIPEEKTNWMIRVEYE